MIICFCTGAEYAITRPASNAIFISTFSVNMLPWVWLATVPFNWGIVALYNRWIPRIGPLKMVVGMALVAIVFNVLFAFLLPIWPKLIFLHYAWKDIYILFMFKQLWSMVHATLSSEKAKYWYGIIFGMGTLGSLVGSSISGFCAVVFGSEKLFFLTAPVYAILVYAYVKAMRYSSLESTSLKKEGRGVGGVKLVFQNRLLVAILVLVVFMQISVALIEYQFNHYLELNILDKDLRTEYCGRVYGLTNLLSGLFQFVGSFALIQWIGLRGNHLLVPLLLLLNGLVIWMIPGFGLLTFSLIFVKALDFSLFGVVKEMLYIPLRLDEKYQAKAVIDVFAWRTSKAVISLAILGLQLFMGDVMRLVGIMTISVFVIWFLFALLFLKKDLRIYAR